jgi:predicted nucleic acid-binding protein
LIAFCDSSALVKRYADEPGSEQIRALDAIAASQLAVVEVPAALWRKHRTGVLRAESARALGARFRADCQGAQPAVSIAGVTTAILDAAALLVARHPLRAYDAVQLASAIAAARTNPGLRFACFDTTLSAAAAAEGLASI